MKYVHNLSTEGHRIELEYNDDDERQPSLVCSVRRTTIHHGHESTSMIATFEVSPTPCCGLDTVHNFWLDSACEDLTLRDWFLVFTRIADKVSTSGFQFVFVKFPTYEMEEDGICYNEWLTKLRVLGAHVARPYRNYNTDSLLYVTTLPVPGMERRLKAYERRLKKEI